MSRLCEAWHNGRIQENIPRAASRPYTGSLCRHHEQERERMAAEFCSTMQASAAEHEAQLRCMRQERREADEDTARHHAAAMQGMQQVHELEQVLLLLPCSMLQNSLAMGCLMLHTRPHLNAKHVSYMNSLVA